MPIEDGGRELKLTSTDEPAMRVVANRRGGADLAVRGVVRGKTSVSLSLAQRADDRLLITDVDSQRSAEAWGGSGQAYTPIFVDCPPSSGYPAGGPVWEEALRTLGLDAGDGHTR
ncbi:ParA family protein [Streptomyces sp. NPDC004549]|uniref:ParA family protein n=1 Tax=Streptomyces sp. NPDC004549 TaxID=3154283 RepID=UPI0033B2F2CC